MRVTPYLGFGYLHVHTDSFTETRGTTAQNVQAMDPNSFTTPVGVRATMTWQIGGTVFRPELRAAWQREFVDETATVRAAFVAAPGSVFTATGTSFGSDGFLGGAGITTTITASTQAFFDYDAKVTGGYTAQSVSDGLRVQFYNSSPSGAATGRRLLAADLTIRFDELHARKNHLLNDL
jgi:outer membrane autotransporter protein